LAQPLKYGAIYRCAAELIAAINNIERVGSCSPIYTPDVDKFCAGRALRRTDFATPSFMRVV
jgi:hypothetical protein